MSGGKLSPESPPVLPSLVQLPPPCPLRPQCQAQPLFSPGGGKQAPKTIGCAGGYWGDREIGETGSRGDTGDAGDTENIVRKCLRSVTANWNYHWLTDWLTRPSSRDASTSWILKETYSFFWTCCAKQVSLHHWGRDGKNKDGDEEGWGDLHHSELLRFPGCLLMQLFEP